MAFVSQIDIYKINDALDVEQWILSMQEELNQFERNKVWELVPRPNSEHIIYTF